MDTREPTAVSERPSTTVPSEQPASSNAPSQNAWDAVRLNNIGARMIAAGRHEEAIGALCEALAASKRLVLAPFEEPVVVEPLSVVDNAGSKTRPQGPYHVPRQEGTASASPTEQRRQLQSMEVGSGDYRNDDTVDRMNTDHQSYHSPIRTDGEHGARSKPLYPTETTVGSRSRAHHYLHRTPFLIPLRGYPGHFSRVQYAVTCMFNLALCHQLWFTEGRNPPKQGINAARRLYELAYNLIMQPEQEADVAGIFTLAIINNLGQLHRIQGDHNKARRCFEHLLSTLMFFAEYDGYDSMEGLEGFFSTVSQLMLRDPMTARAA